MHGSAILSRQQMHVLLFSYVFFSGILLVSWLLFLTSVHKTMRLVSKNKRVFPRWFLWLSVLLVLSYVFSWWLSSPLVPFVSSLIGLVFAWLMIPFGVPNSLARMAATPQDLLCQKVRVLRRIGLTCLLCLSIMYGLKLFLFLATPNMLTLEMAQPGSVASYVIAASLAVVGALALITWVYYWVRVIAIRSNA